METSPLAVLTIAGMTLFTYLTRIGGLWLISILPRSGRIQAGLNHLPATLLSALIAPIVLSGSLPQVGAALTTLVVAIRTRNVLLSLLTGVLTVFLLRILLHTV